MPRFLDEVRQLTHRLPEDRRTLLAESLLESLGPEGEERSAAEIDSAWGNQIRRRLDVIGSEAVKTNSHDEFVAGPDAHIASKLQA